MNYPIWLCVSFFAPVRAGTIFSELESATTIQQWANYNEPGSGPFFFQCVRCQRMRQKDFPFRHSNRIEKREKIREKAKSVAVFLWMFFLLAFVGFPSFVQAEWKWLHIWKKIIVNKASKRKFFLCWNRGLAVWQQMCIFCDDTELSAVFERTELRLYDIPSPNTALIHSHGAGCGPSG